MRFNVVAPGRMTTDFGGGAIRDNAQLNQFIASTTALARAGVLNGDGPMIASLVSDDNRWVPGQRIEVSGGMLLQRKEPSDKGRAANLIPGAVLRSDNPSGPAV